MIRTLILAVLLPAAVFAFTASQLGAVALPISSLDSASLVFAAFGLAALTLVRD
jgi:hypothetical protein